MLILLIILFPFLVGLGMISFKDTTRSLIGFFGILLTLLPISYGAITDSTVKLIFPFLFEATWTFHHYTLISAVSFTVVGAILALFITQYLNRGQILSFCIALSSSIGITMTTGFVSLFILWELLTISTSLIIFFEDDYDKSIGLKFLITHLVGGLALLVGIFFHYNATGSLELTTPVAGQLFFLIGIGMKVGFIPLHFWIPATYSRINPTSTVALSIFTTKAGIIILTKLFSELEPLIYMGLLMIFFGIFQSLKKQQLREILSYQHISQLGFMVVSIGAGGMLGVTGGLFHMANHMVYKSLLFMSSAIIFLYTNHENLYKQKQKPLWLLGFTLVGSMAIMGLPPFNGFVSKTVIKYASPDFIVVLLNLGAVGTALAFARFLYYGFWHTTDEQKPNKRFSQINIEVKIAMSLLAGLIVILGIAPPILNILSPYGYTNVLSVSGALQSLGAALLGTLLFIVFKKRLQPVEILKTNKSKYSKVLLNIINTSMDHIAHAEKKITQLNNAQLIIPIFTVIILLAMLIMALG